MASPHADMPRSGQGASVTSPHLNANEINWDRYFVLLPQESKAVPRQDKLEALRDMLPDNVRSVSPTAQVEYFEHLMESFRQHQDDESVLEEHRQYKARVLAAYKPLHPRVYDIGGWEIVPSLKKAIADGSKPALAAVLDRQGDDIYSFDLVPPSFASVVMEEVAHFEKWCEDNKMMVHRPNSMNSYGAIVDDFGMEKVMDQLMQIYVKPFSKLLYPHVVGDFDSHHAFCVEYQIGKDEKLDFHVDDSDVTLNLCLGREFTGGDLWFGGIRCHRHVQTGLLPDEECIVKHKVGQGLIHLGKHRHLARGINSGHRMNLILWCRSSMFRSQLTDECPQWCGVNPLLEHDPNYASGHGS